MIYLSVNLRNDLDDGAQKTPDRSDNTRSDGPPVSIFFIPHPKITRKLSKHKYKNPEDPSHGKHVSLLSEGLKLISNVCYEVHEHLIVSDVRSPR
jgi:hypothetical protein